MKKNIIIVAISICAMLVGGTLVYNNVNKQNPNVEVEYLKSSISELKSDLESSQATVSIYTDDQLRITELETKLAALEIKLNDSITNTGTLQNKITEQGQAITSLKSRVTSLEQAKISKVIGTWKGIIPAVGNVKYIFNENGTINYSIEEKSVENTYTYTGNVIITAGDIMFYNLTSETTMTIYYTGSNGGFYTYKLTKVQ